MFNTVIPLPEVKMWPDKKGGLSWGGLDIWQEERHFMGGALYDKRVVFDWEGPYKRGTTKYFCQFVFVLFCLFMYVLLWYAVMYYKSA